MILITLKIKFNFTNRQQITSIKKFLKCDLSKIFEKKLSKEDLKNSVCKTMNMRLDVNFSETLSLAENSATIGGLEFALQYWDVYLLYIVLCSFGALFGVIGINFFEKVN